MKKIILSGLAFILSCVANQNVTVTNSPLAPQVNSVSSERQKSDYQIIFDAWLAVDRQEQELIGVKWEQNRWPAGTRMNEIYGNIFDDTERKYLSIYEEYCKTRQRISPAVLAEFESPRKGGMIYLGSYERPKVRIEFTNDGMSVGITLIGNCSH